LYTAIVVILKGAMLKPKQDQLANEFYQAAFADGEVDAKTKI
jgi:hypothetical protein